MVTGNRVWKGLPCKAQWFTTLWLYKEYYYRGSGILHKTDNTHKLLVKIVSYFCLHFTQLHNFFLEPGFIYISSDCKACHIYIFVATTLFRLAVAVTPVQKQTLLLLQYLLGITCWNPSRCQHLLPADSHFFVVIFFFFSPLAFSHLSWLVTTELVPFPSVHTGSNSERSRHTQCSPHAVCSVSLSHPSACNAFHEEKQSRPLG